ncbi:TPA: transcriptional regulator [Enterobacter cloacae]|uniref:helix-turn-helix domain-containing protein n=1 Tax=Enterobacter cloacae complex TaxID=354276 RepID=UPI000735B593|nr:MULTISPECIES: helix-turn-helix domain-containing protein [Enterobacter cloacae complex]KTI64150.1 transcriptional regulator [Enterobacter cloacae subsp. cloacae]KVI53497.1 transcriptional regulator [Enterobacter cloacae subsp. cloacae]MCM7450867.1 helix-turn-helix domain-containing protein [Enterobacter cloacae]MCU6208210.1 helix-turn-helix domain-containing protein [Enterobacter cloacae]MDD7872163.1 helix-turn-helix domain-containing protein [Enterobacter cloacae complex sp. 2022EL-00981]
MKVNAKPLSELSRLEQCLKVASTPFKSAPQQIISNDDNDEPSTFVLQTGVIEIYRRSDELLIGIATAPFILGLTASMLDYSKEYRVVAKNPCTGFYLPASTSLQLIQQSSLWKEAFCWLSWIKSILEKRDRQLVGNNSYHQIRAMLLNMAEWDETLRSKIGVMNHIQQSTRISRSVVAEVLAALRQGNYINMSRGKLVSINRLPTEY